MNTGSPFDVRLDGLYTELRRMFDSHTPHSVSPAAPFVVACPADARCDVLNEQIVEALKAAFPPDAVVALCPIPDVLLDVDFGMPARTVRDALSAALMQAAYDQMFPNDDTLVDAT